MNGKRWIAVLGATLVLVGLAWAGASLLSGSQVLAGPDPVQKWEYLIITTGEDVEWQGTSSIAAWSTPLSKAVGLSTGPLREAVEMEALLDKTGKAGWELVAVVGMIGGQQEFVFKRPFP